MNNKGFGLTEVIIFIVASLITLVICVIVYDRNFGNINTEGIDEATQIIGESVKDNKKDDEIEEDSKTKENKDYKELLDKMTNSAKMYVSNNYTGKTEQVVIKLSELVNKDYMDQLLDPSDAEVICSGYVIYDGENNYTPYLKCGENYESENYNNEFE